MASNNSGNRSSVLSRPARRIIQNFLLVWLDTQLNESMADFKNSLVQIKRVVASIETYKDEQECIEYIQQVKDQKVFLIVSGTTGQNFVPVTNEWDQIDSIYVFCSNKPFHEEWSKIYSKVKGVHTSIEPICKALEIDLQRCEQNTIAISFQSGDLLFMYTQLIKEAILQVDYDEAASLKELVAFCRQQEDIEDRQIKLIENDYKKHEPIWWYTAPIFIYTMLSRCLRVFDVDILMKMGFFIYQLDRQIRELSKQQCADPKDLKIIGQAHFVVYRGQGLTQDDFNKLKLAEGRQMCFNSFLATSYSRNYSLDTFARPAIKNGYVGILFIINISTDVCLKADIPFIEITGDTGYYVDREGEILFSTHTLFKINDIKHLNDPVTSQLYEVNLTIGDPKDHELVDLSKNLEEELAHRSGYSRLGFLLNKAQQSKQAMQLYENLLKSPSSILDSIDYKQQLGWAYNNMGDYPKALSIYEEALQMQEKNLPKNHLDFSKTYRLIGIVYGRLGKYSEALEYHEKALGMRRKQLPNNHPDIAQMHNNIANVYDDMGDYSNALSSHQLSLEIRKQILPPNHPDLAGSYNNIGTVYHNMGDYSKALSSYEQSLEIRKQVLPRNHPDLATSYNNIGAVYHNMGDYSKALSSYEQSLEIRMQVLRPNHPDLASSYNNIGIVYRKMGDYSKALSSYEQSLEIWKQVLPRNHPDLATSYNNIGAVYHNMGDYSKALSSFQQSLEIQKQVLPPSHPDLATSYNNIGAVNYDMDDYSKALSSYEQSLEIRKQVLPPNHPDLATSYNNIGAVYHNMGDYSKALSSYEESLEIRKQVLRPNHTDLATSYNNIGAVYHNMGDYSKALSSYEQSLEIRMQVLRPNHPDLASSYNNIGFAYENTKEYTKALSYYEKALQIWQTSLPEEHPHIALVKGNIQQLKRKM